MSCQYFIPIYNVEIRYISGYTLKVIFSIPFLSIFKHVRCFFYQFLNIVLYKRDKRQVKCCRCGKQTKLAKPYIYIIYICIYVLCIYVSLCPCICIRVSVYLCTCVQMYIYPSISIYIIIDTTLMSDEAQKAETLPSVVITMVFGHIERSNKMSQCARSLPARPSGFDLVSHRRETS